jgi:tripartite-type tricarboxylate transporter receptor subunit TctC
MPDSRDTQKGARRAHDKSWGLVALALFAFLPSADAQQKPKNAYPERPIRFLVPFATGGTADILARVLAQNFSQILGQQVVVDNRAGSGGVLGTEIAANSPGDGYTLLMGNISTIAVSPALYRKLPYDPNRDFAPVTLVGSAPFVMVVPAALGLTTVKQFVALAKSKSGKLNYASTGVGSPGHLSGALLSASANINIEHVPYKAIAPALVDLSSGEVQLLFLGIGPTQAQLKMGKVRAIAISSAQRSPLMPDLPTVAESGVPGFDVTGWYGLFVPAATSPKIIEQLNATVRQTSTTPEIQKRFSTLGAELIAQSPKEFAAFVRAEIQKWAKVVKDSGIQPE